MILTDKNTICNRYIRKRIDKYKKKGCANNFKYGDKRNKI